jgi:hypothetical protein
VFQFLSRISCTLNRTFQTLSTGLDGGPPIPLCTLSKKYEAFTRCEFFIPLIRAMSKRNGFTKKNRVSIRDLYAVHNAISVSWRNANDDDTWCGCSSSSMKLPPERVREPRMGTHGKKNRCSHERVKRAFRCGGSCGTSAVRSPTKIRNPTGPLTSSSSFDKGHFVLYPKRIPPSQCSTTSLSIT